MFSRALVHRLSFDAHHIQIRVDGDDDVNPEITATQGSAGDDAIYHASDSQW